LHARRSESGRISFAGLPDVGVLLIYTKKGSGIAAGALFSSPASGGIS